jgi:hypothetical protein
LQLEEMYLSHNCIMEDHVIEKFSKWAIHWNRLQWLEFYPQKEHDSFHFDS